MDESGPNNVTCADHQNKLYWYQVFLAVTFTNNKVSDKANDYAQGRLDCITCMRINNQIKPVRGIIQNAGQKYQGAVQVIVKRIHWTFANSLTLKWITGHNVSNVDLSEHNISQIIVVFSLPTQMHFQHSWRKNVTLKTVLIFVLGLRCSDKMDRNSWAKFQSRWHSVLYKSCFSSLHGNRKPPYSISLCSESFTSSKSHFWPAVHIYFP